MSERIIDPVHAAKGIDGSAQSRGPYLFAIAELGEHSGLDELTPGHPRRIAWHDPQDGLVLFPARS